LLNLLRQLSHFVAVCSNHLLDSVTDFFSLCVIDGTDIREGLVDAGPTTRALALLYAGTNSSS